MEKETNKEKVSISINSEDMEQLKKDSLLTKRKNSLSTAIEFEYKAFNFLMYNILKEVKGVFTFDELRKISNMVDNNFTNIHNAFFGYRSLKVRHKRKENRAYLSPSNDGGLNSLIYKKILKLGDSTTIAEELLEINKLARKVLKLNENQVFSLIWHVTDFLNEDGVNSIYSRNQMLLDEEELKKLPPLRKELPPKEFFEQLEAQSTNDYGYEVDDFNE